MSSLDAAPEAARLFCPNPDREHTRADEEADEGNEEKIESARSG